MGYMLIIDNENKNIEIHSDLCDVVFDKKEDLNINTKLEFIPFNFYEEIEEYLQTVEGYEVVDCEVCKPKENQEELDEDYDDFYEEFDDDEEVDSTRCDII
ncbi:hypothetical protein NAMH_0188 [Nautilia profundicola AmH]|uniref:Uncharacterized protein n=1 Tax=Nautilia profundicola (strain ATCC BAA-1463 / DSM 18972 / AmH) TaxID=598659 RepID=B9L7K4_NAUPA|nr:hypothetical protein [Nautilia profundicola]ACM93106.1 hypothetical protein NAMH_0188 [Nautilia profundicola AmH]